MKTKNNIIAALIISGLSAFAGSPQAISNTEFLTANAAPVKTKEHKKNLLKIKKPAFFSKSGSGMGPGDINGGGLFVNVGIYLPSNSYLNPLYAYTQEKAFNFGLDAELGHFFKIVKISKFSIGLRATWISLGYASKDGYNAITASPVRVGPQFVFALKEKIAVNLFYQIGAAYTLVSDDSDNTSLLGLTHEIGAGFQYRILNIGLGYRFGGLSNLSESNDPFTYPTNNLRLFVGFKF